MYVYDEDQGTRAEEDWRAEMDSPPPKSKKTSIATKPKKVRNTGFDLGITDEVLG
jgi:hypothetical protein